MAENEVELRVYVIDDHPVVRQGLVRALAGEPGMVVVGHTGTALEALNELAACAPDVVLVDLNLPDRDGIELLGALRGTVPNAKLVVLTCYEDELHVAEAMRAGVHGYLVKTSRMEELIDGIRRAAAGDTPISPSIADVMVRAMRRSNDDGAGSLDALTPRERQVFRLLAAGLSTRDAASRLDLSPKTVETHRMRIYEKLGCKRAAELTRIAVRMRLIEA